MLCLFANFFFLQSTGWKIKIYSWNFECSIHSKSLFRVTKVIFIQLRFSLAIAQIYESIIWINYFVTWTSNNVLTIISTIVTRLVFVWLFLPITSSTARYYIKLRDHILMRFSHRVKQKNSSEQQVNLKQRRKVLDKRRIT